MPPDGVAALASLSPAAGLSAAERAEALRWSVRDGCFHAVMLGAGESFLGALAVELGHDASALALLLTLPLLAGALAQLGSSALARGVGGRRRLVILSASLQALSHVIFMGIAVSGSASFLVLLAAKSLFWVAGSIAAPAWGAWMATLTEGLHRERFFSRRSAAIQGVLLLSFVGAGLLLHAARSTGAVPLLHVFVGLHAVAAVARTASALCLRAQRDLETPRLELPVRAQLRDAIRTSAWRAPLLAAGMLFGAYLAVPFFTPYMLRELRLSYAEFTGLIALPILAKALTYPVLHRLSARFGLRRIFLAAGGGIAAVSALWGVSASLPVLAAAQALSGVAWGAFEFANFQLQLRGARESCRLEFLSITNSLSGVVQLAGAFLGARLLAGGALDHEGLFLTSGIARALPLVAVGLWLPVLAGRELPRALMRLTSVRPAGGLMGRPVAFFDAAIDRTARQRAATNRQNP